MEIPKIIWFKNKAYAGSNEIGYIESNDDGGGGYYYRVRFLLDHRFCIFTTEKENRTTFQHEEFDKAQKYLEKWWDLWWNNLSKNLEKCENCPFLLAKEELP